MAGIGCSSPSYTYTRLSRWQEIRFAILMKKQLENVDEIDRVRQASEQQQQSSSQERPTALNLVSFDVAL